MVFTSIRRKATSCSAASLAARQKMCTKDWDAEAYLSANGVVVRAVGAYGIADGLRMTIGSEEANRLTVDLLGAFMAAG